MPRPNPYTAEAKVAILAEYAAGASMHALQRKYGGTRFTISRMTASAGVRHRTAAERQRRLPVRHDAFADAAASEEAAYWVGMLMADGCVYYHTAGRGESHYLHLGLHAKDLSHIEKYKSFLRAEQKIVHTSVLRKPVRDKPPVRVDMCELRIGSRQLVADLAKYGVVPRKSKIAEVVGLENNRHFWRGVIDGDGNLRWTTNARLPDQHPRACLQVIGSKFLMSQFERYCNSIVGAAGKAHRSRECWAFLLNSNKAADMIAHLYMNCTTALDRKMALAHEILCGWELRPQNQKPPKPPPPAFCMKCGLPSREVGLCDQHYAALRAANMIACVKYRARVRAVRSSRAEQGDDPGAVLG